MKLKGRQSHLAIPRTGLISLQLHFLISRKSILLFKDH